MSGWPLSTAASTANARGLGRQRRFESREHDRPPRRLHRQRRDDHGRAASQPERHSGRSSHFGASPVARLTRRRQNGMYRNIHAAATIRPVKRNRAVDEQHERDEEHEDECPEGDHLQLEPAHPAAATVVGLDRDLRGVPAAAARRARPDLAVGGVTRLSALAADPDRRRLGHVPILRRRRKRPLPQWKRYCVIR